ncbi:tRNA threonylcarbamoyladenosine biosynthesis protein TsaB [Sporobacter termitidis DSM 10068]|uniref:tRNA threonylcarbamoyladenosine biosynthesis protein TsaB n=1 Tax=Sporobacter termitidis DSM 10068 TaxID=1123282 RepID=A0A1M5TBJ0_9FIRM|nr:tRNA (adenosine(37)-N6)-threonylcarbamoyltransferase complex dimerization subunit type 1 TsaB [Sporobacter termitidis]SHH48102.1 tRNA threonylcarbamoyladenosine biosynthesis protein TsaB [Sporobacter termitidis DSM 10068]
MKILAIESSAKSASVAVCEDRALLTQYFQSTGLTHSRTLLKMAEDMLKNADLSIRGMDVVAVASGPGSFTGIRIGVSAAIGLAWGADLPVCGVSTLEAMAYNAEEPGYVVCPVMDARRDQVYTASFLNPDGSLTRLTPDRALSLNELTGEAMKDGRPYLLLGDGALKCHEAFMAAGIACRLAPPLLRPQSAWGVACASLNAPKLTPDALRPNYLRLSQAERERAEKAAKA